MSDPAQGSYRNLIAKLSDGMLTDADADQLRSILKQDKISQETYLDHIFVHALLENEFGAAASLEDSIKDAQSASLVGTLRTDNKNTGFNDQVAPPRFANVFQRAASGLPSWTLVGSAVALLLFGLVAVTVIINHSELLNSEETLPLTLANSSFETHTSVSPSAESLANWFGDHAVTVEDWSDIEPVDGKRMLRFVKSTYDPAHVCEVYQVIDLASYPNYSEEDVSVIASAFFNARQDDASDEASRFSVAMFAMAEEPRGFAEKWEQGTTPALAYAGQLEKADRDASSWQQVESKIDLPEGARFLVVQLSVIDGAKNEIQRTREHFVDSVAVNMVSGK